MPWAHEPTDVLPLSLFLFIYLLFLINKKNTLPQIRELTVTLPLQIQVLNFKQNKKQPKKSTATYQSSYLILFNLYIYIYIKPKLLKLLQFSTLARYLKKKHKPKKRKKKKKKKKHKHKGFSKTQTRYIHSAFSFLSLSILKPLYYSPRVPASHSFSG